MSTPTREGWVYILKPIDHNVYKIGCTTNLQNRINRMRKKYGFEVQYVTYKKYLDYEGAERYWHKQFNGRHLIGEWFLLTEDDIQSFEVQS